jgi:hypothetical protein
MGGFIAQNLVGFLYHLPHYHTFMFPMVGGFIMNEVHLQESFTILKQVVGNFLKTD